MNTNNETTLYSLPEPAANEIDARPTKGLFIEMLTKDIDLLAAINDLIDNSVDGAKRLRGNADYDGLYVRVTTKDGHFGIKDNCGGIDAEVARLYAFRFGRPRESKPVKNSVGLFGVGMKRAFFKMGANFHVVSVTDKTSFSLDVDVEKWKDEANHWVFPFQEDKPRIDRLDGVIGTQIDVGNLTASVRTEFGSQTFTRDLIDSVKRAQQSAINNNLQIEIDGRLLVADAPTLLSSPHLKPLYLEENIAVGNRFLQEKLYIGVAKSSPSDAGWYVYCNGRLVLAADKSIVTGWGSKAANENIPNYHNQYSRFRGYIYLDADDPTLLPYNTTKSGVDAESPIFKSIRSKMIGSARPVLKFLDVLKAEGENQSEETPLETALDKAEPTALPKLTLSSFISPIAGSGPPPAKKISYTKEAELVEKMMKTMGVSTTKAVGERSFDYYYEQECVE